MGEAEALPSGVAWFTDPRTCARRMKVAWHPEAGVVVLSLWTADQCTASFRLPIDRAPELMHLLIDVVADQRPLPQPAPFTSLRDRLRNILRVGSRRNPVASVTPIRRSR